MKLSGKELMTGPVAGYQNTHRPGRVGHHLDIGGSRHAPLTMALQLAGTIACWCGEWAAPAWVGFAVLTLLLLLSTQVVRPHEPAGAAAQASSRTSATASWRNTSEAAAGAPERSRRLLHPGGNASASRSSWCSAGYSKLDAVNSFLMMSTRCW